MAFYNTYINVPQLFTFGKYKGYSVFDVLFGRSQLLDHHVEAYFYHRLESLAKVTVDNSLLKSLLLWKHFDSWNWILQESFNYHWPKGYGDYCYLTKDFYNSKNVQKSEGRLLSIVVSKSITDLQIINSLDACCNSTHIHRFCEPFPKFLRNYYYFHSFRKSIISANEITPEPGYYKFVDHLRKSEDTEINLPNHTPEYLGLSDYNYVFWCIDSWDSFVIDPFYLDILSRTKVFEFDKFNFEIKYVLDQGDNSLYLIKVLPQIVEKNVEVPQYIKDINQKKINQHLSRHFDEVNRLYDAQIAYKDEDYYEEDAIQNAIWAQKDAEDDYRYKELLKETTNEAIKNSLYEGDASNYWNID